MRLAMFRSPGHQPTMGIVDVDHVVDAAATHRAHLRAVDDDCDSDALIDGLVPDDVVTYLRGGSRSRAALAESLDWLRQEHADGRDPAGPWGRPLRHRLADVRLEAPVLRPPKIICVGLNYRDHAEEQGARIPANPILFAKYTPSIVGPDAEVVHPPITEQLDYEAELAVVIGRRGRNIAAQDAAAHIAGFTCFNDVTARDIQLADRQWLRGKMGDTHAPIGPWLVTPDELGPLGELTISLDLNGERLQSSRLDQLIFGVPEIVSFISESVTLEVGDVIATGTPGGVGFARTPPRFMKPGDTVEMTISGIGTLRNTIVAS